MELRPRAPAALIASPAPVDNNRDLSPAVCEPVTNSQGAPKGAVIWAHPGNLELPAVSEKILFVDDEPAVLDGYMRLLHREFQVCKAVGANDGLAAFDREGPFAVVVSDMRMPGINGAQFLAEVRRRFPDTVRMLLTGYSDINAAIQAVNEGCISKFLSKPCEKSVLVEAVNSGLAQYRTTIENQALLKKAREAALPEAEQDAKLLDGEEPTGLPASCEAESHFATLHAAKTQFYMVMFTIGGLSRIEQRYGSGIADDYIRETARFIAQKLQPEDRFYQHDCNVVLALLQRTKPPFSVRAELLSISNDTSQFQVTSSDWSAMLRRHITFRVLPGNHSRSFRHLVTALTEMPE